LVLLNSRNCTDALHIFNLANTNFVLDADFADF